MKKTVREWLEELPEPYRTQAIENADEETLTNDESTIKYALLIAFQWKESLQGSGYWTELYYTLPE